MNASAKISKFYLYEKSVQNPEWHVKYPSHFHRRLLGHRPLKFREDFCGSGLISCEWVKSSKLHIATGLDRDRLAIRYANQKNKAELSQKQRKRLNFNLENVLYPTEEKYDLIGAYNFSIFEFHERGDLLKYFTSVFNSLGSQGTFFFDIAGGSGFLKTRQKSRNIFIDEIGTVQQIWEQMDYDPISATNQYAIHFMLPCGSCLNDAFTYHWRIWQVREVREVLKEAGFKMSTVIWEKDSPNPAKSGKSYFAENAENAFTWVAYLVGVK